MQQYPSNSSGMDFFTAYLRGMCEGDGLQGRGEAPVAAVDTYRIGETAEGHVKRALGVTRKRLRQESGRHVGGEEVRRKRLLTATGEGEAREYQYASTETSDARVGR